MRKIYLLVVAVFIVATMHAETIYGDCGPHMEWEFNTGSGALYLIGTGPMDDYASFRETPWAQYKDHIKSIQKDSRSQYTTIGDCAFAGCKNLTSVDLPNTVTKISGYAFDNCTGLTSVTIPNSVTSIGQKAFYCCSGLKTIIIPASVQTIGTAAFSSCANLTVIQVSAINPYYSAVDGVLYNKNKTILHQFPAGKNVTSFDIPNTVTEISGSAFEYCSNLTSVTIPNSVTSIGEYAFYCCSGLTSVTIPNSVTSIGNYAFYYCTGLTSPVYNAHVFAYMPPSYSGEYTIPDGIEIISSTAFYSCSNLTSVTIPNSVTNIGDYAFEYCTGLTTITCKAVNPPALGDDVFYDVDTTIPLYVPDQSVSSYLAAEQWKEFDVKAAQGIEDIVVPTGDAQKILMDGVLLIERNGKTYNAQGAEMR